MIWVIVIIDPMKHSTDSDSISIHVILMLLSGFFLYLKDLNVLNKNGDCFGLLLLVSSEN